MHVCMLLSQELLKANIETNKTNLLHNGGSCRTCCFRWEQCHLSLPEAWHVADVVLASDCIYHADLMQPFLASLLATGGCQQCVPMHISFAGQYVL